MFLVGVLLLVSIVEHFLLVDASPLLRFRYDNTFTILQVSDLHFGEGEDVSWGPDQDINSSLFMENLFNRSNVDFIVYSGDQITGGNIWDNATAYWDRIMQLSNKSGIPHASILGNHDAEPNLNSGKNQSAPGAHTNRTALMRNDMKWPLSYSQLGPPELRPAVSVYVIDVYSSLTHSTSGIHRDPHASGTGVAIPTLALYFLDSGGGGMVEEIFAKQVAWYKKMSAERKQRYGRTVPSLLFMHIPFSEFIDAAADPSKCDGDYDDNITPGIKNNGLFQALVDAGEVLAVFVGHDHCNSFVCRYKNLHLVFARHTGFGGYNCNEFVRGARYIIVNASSSSNIQGQPRNESTSTEIRVSTHIKLTNGSTIEALRIA